MEPNASRLTLRGFWESLPTPGRWLPSTTAISTLGRGMTLPFTIIYVHEVRGIELDVAGLLMSLIAGVALVVTGPVGALIDRLGSRVMLIWGNLSQLIGAVILGFLDWYRSPGLDVPGLDEDDVTGAASVAIPVGPLP